MKEYNFEQGSDEWFNARIGSIGGSSIATAVAGGTGKTRTDLMYRFAGEILSGEKYQGYSNHNMERGIELEPKARNWYEFETGNTVRQVGLIRPDSSDHKHESPDGLVDDDGKIEIKCVIPSVHIKTIISENVPAEYRKQVQWGLYICEREWCDFVSYSPSIKNRPIWIKRVHRDEKLIKELNEGADKFIGEMLRIVDKIRG